MPSLIDSLGPELVQRIRALPLNVRQEARRLLRQKLDEKFPPKDAPPSNSPGNSKKK